MAKDKKMPAFIEKKIERKEAKEKAAKGKAGPLKGKVKAKGKPS